MTASSTALAKTDQRIATAGNERSSLARVNMRELKDLAAVFIDSGAFPDVKSASQAMVKIIAGSELGFTPIVSMTGVHFFQGKVSLGANLMASLIKDSGKYEYKILQHTSQICEIAFYQHIGSELKSLGTPVVYTLDDAAKAGLLSKDNWKKYPMDMLFAACIRQGCRRYCADVLRGMTPETDTTADETAVASDTSFDDDKAENVTVDAEPSDDATTDGVALIEAIGELFSIKLGGDEAEISKALKGQNLAEMSIAALEQLRGDLAAM